MSANFNLKKNVRVCATTIPFAHSKQETDNPIMLHRRSSAVVIVLMMLASSLSLPAKDKVFTMPRAFHAKTYPAHDAHDDEQVTLAVDPYDTPDKQMTVFRTQFVERNILPIHFILSNDSGAIITLTQMSILLITKKRVKIEPASNDDIFRRLSSARQRLDMPNPSPLPRRTKSSVPKEAQEEVPAAQFTAVAVEPKSTQAGFLFFDVEDIENPLAGARLVVTGIRTSNGKELFYFEIPLEKYLGYKPGQ